jgi:hypothetical protein
MEDVPLTSINRTPADVRYRCKSGKHLLVLSFSQFDPKRRGGPVLAAVQNMGIDPLATKIAGFRWGLV